MGRRLALLIGSRIFDDPKLRRLQKPAADVASLASVLRDPFIGGFDDVKTSIDPSVAVVRRAVAALFAQKLADDLLLLYFAGHGIKDEYGQLYLATTDTDSELLSATTLAADFVTREMDRSRSRKQLLILDCCFSGAFIGTRAPETVGAGHAFATDDAAGRVILTASDAFQYAWENETNVSAVNSLFTHYLVDGLRTGKADTNNDGIITADEWYDYVYAHVRAATPKQTPQRTVYSGAGSLLVARNRQLTIPLPEEVTSALKSPLPYVREGVAHELARLLTGSHVGLQTAARDALHQLTTDVDARVRNLASTKLGVGKFNRQPPASEPPVARRTPAERRRSLANTQAVEQPVQPTRRMAATGFGSGVSLFIFIVLELTLVVEAAILLVNAANQTSVAREHPEITPLAIAIILLATAAFVRWRDYHRDRKRRVQVIVVFLVLVLLVGVAPIVYLNNWLQDEARIIRPVTTRPAQSGISPITTTMAATNTATLSTTSSEMVGKTVLYAAPTSRQPVRLSTITGEISGAAEPTNSWTQLRYSWFVNQSQEEKRGTLLVFWATWCVPCMLQLPLLDLIYEEHRPVRFVGLSDEPDAPVSRLLITKAVEPYHFRLHYFLKDSLVSQQVFGKADVPLPAFALFDGDGKLVFTLVGGIEDPKRAQALRGALASLQRSKTKSQKE